MKMLFLIGLLVLATPFVASAQVPSCEDQLALANQLLQDIHQEKGQLQYQAASLKVQLGRVQQEIKTLKDVAPEAKK